MSKFDELLRATAGGSQRTLLELANKVIEENRVTFDGIAETLVDSDDCNAVEVYKRLVGEMFADRIVHWGRITVFFALTIFFRDRFNLNLDDEATTLMSEHFPGWIEEQQSAFRWNRSRFYVALICAVLSVKLIKAMILSHLFHSSL